MASRPVQLRPGRFLPRDPRLDAPFRLTPQLVFRIGILGFLTLAAFAVLFFRLWALQVLSGNQYLVAAENNQLRVIRTDAPRGPIEDRYGRVIVQNTNATAVKIWPADLPKHGAYAELKRLAGILQVPLSDVTKEIKKNRGDPVTPVTVRDDVGENDIRYLYEHQSEFPGMAITDTFVRNYPFGDLAAPILGYVGEVTKDQLKSSKAYAMGDQVGQAGIESSFDKELRGRSGLEQLRVDSLGRPISPIELRTPVTPGYAVRLTLDAKLQRAAQKAIVSGINLAQANHQWYAKAGAIVALDPRDGSIRALASYPTFDPALYTSHKKNALAPLLDPKVAQADNYPALDRAIAGAYPPGSTFKPVTALAGMQEHILSPYNALACTGTYKAAGQVFKNWDPFVNTSMTLPTALAQSCDTYFYQVGKAFYDLPPSRGQPLQRWAKTFGFGEQPGLDFGPATSGLLPTIAWKHRTFTKKTDPSNWQIDRLWKPGDSIQLAIGQKDMLASPLQMARFYALLANGGNLVTPHIVSAIEQPGPQNGPQQGALVLRRYQAPIKALNLDSSGLTAIRDGLYEATHSSLGTSSSTFGSYPIPIAGKTGTAETHAVDAGGYAHATNTSWWCGFGPFNAPRLVVCAVIENGGFGGEVAAPSALRVFEQFFGQKATNVSTAPTD